jgi:molybdopterin-guanine dinucleotide biosynthesis protein A
MAMVNGRLAVVILAGGMSRRMGTDKAWALLDDRPLVAHVVERMRTLSPDELLVITRDPAPYAPLGVVACTDLVPEQGPLGGLYTALRTLDAEHFAVVACDMPFASAAIFRRLLTEQRESEATFEAVLPRWRGQPQPLHALYHRSALSTVEAHLQRGQLRMLDLITGLRTRLVDTDDAETAFVNLNTPEALNAAQKMER